MAGEPEASTLIRHNVWGLGDDWAEPILWYARGVAAMKQKAFADPTSWRFHAAMHGFNVARWKQLGALGPAEQLPDIELIRQFWAQRRHGSWYFLPWRRGYLMAFEANVRAEIERLGGPPDWALPYWNYLKPGQGTLPAAFASADWPDGTGDNPLFVVQRYGPVNDGRVFVPVSLVNLEAMADPDFTGVSSGGSPGFGGVDTGFSHSGQVHGGIETQPNNWVHGVVGGADPMDQNLAGAMSDPRTAGLDPIFWLHHANIDRLWEAWLAGNPAHANPSEAKWLRGPTSVGERRFSAPMPDGTTWEYTPGEVTALEALGYCYDDLEPGAPAPQTPAERRVRLGMPPVAEQEAGMQVDVELLGANDHQMPLRGSEASTRVRMDPGMRRRVARSLSPGADAAAGRASPDRVFLNLENVRGRADAAAFHVYVGVCEDQDPNTHAERLAGSIAPFGVSEASEGDAEHAGQGLTFVLEITRIVDDMHLGDEFDGDDLPVRIVPVRPIADEAGMSMGRISIYRHGS